MSNKPMSDDPKFRKAVEYAAKESSKEQNKLLDRKVLNKRWYYEFRYYNGLTERIYEYGYINDYPPFEILEKRMREVDGAELIAFYEENELNRRVAQAVKEERERMITEIKSNMRVVDYRRRTKGKI